jgi:beta-N-acetylhexosaminidase
MDPAQAAGGTLMVGIGGPELDRETVRLLERLRPGGVILFRRNLTRPEALIDLQAGLAEILPAPRLIAIDQEGGRVSRLEPWIGETPRAAEIAAWGGQAAFRFGLATAGCLGALGINLDFAPVVDLCDPDSTNGIGDRSFGTDPSAAAALAGSFLDGLQKGGIAGCLKHFPGLGDTPVDSHRELPTCERSRVRLEEEDLVPYRTLAPKAACVMVGHGYYPALEDETGVPATLSRRIVGGILRRDLNYQGLVVSDDMEMGAVASLDLEGRAAVMALAAGCDLVPYCSDPDRALRAWDALAESATDDPSFADRLSEASRAVQRLAATHPVRRPDPAAWEQAREELEHASRPPSRRTWSP